MSLGSVEIEIRPIGIDDAVGASRLMTELGYPTRSEQMTSRLALIAGRSDFVTFIAACGPSLVGLIGACVAPYYEHDGLYGRIVTMVTAEQERGKGIGERLVRRAESWFVERGVTHVIVNSGNQREGAHEFYRRLGYQPTGTRFVRALPASSLGQN
jgi:GNAT superfamily N-acetyltransferase